MHSSRGVIWLLKWYYDKEWLLTAYNIKHIHNPHGLPLLFSMLNLFWPSNLDLFICCHCSFWRVLTEMFSIYKSIEFKQTSHMWNYIFFLFPRSLIIYNMQLHHQWWFIIFFFRMKSLNWKTEIIGDFIDIREATQQTSEWWTIAIGSPFIWLLQYLFVTISICNWIFCICVTWNK